MARYARTCVLFALLPIGAGGLAVACGHLPFDELPVASDGGSTEAGDGGVSDAALDGPTDGPDGGKPSDGGDGGHDGGDGGCGELCNVTFVSAAVGDDTNPGTAAQPVKTIHRGLSIASARTGKQEVRVAQGVYAETIALVENVDLLGGYDCGDESCTWARDITDNDSAIVAQAFEGVVAGSSITQKTRLEGFRIVGKSGALPNTNTLGGAALSILGGTPIVSRCRIFGADISGGSAQGRRSIGVAVLGPSNAPSGVQLDHSSIVAGTATDGAFGVVLDAPTNGDAGPVVVLKANVIRGGNAANTAGIVALHSAAGTLVSDNDIGAGSSTGQGSTTGAWGIVASSTMTIDANRINVDGTLAGSCTSVTGSQPFCGGGILSLGSTTTITNNVVLGVKGPKSAAVYLTQSEGVPGPVVVNGNTLDGAGNGANNNALSVGIAFGVGNGNTLVVGKVRNNILLAGTNTPRYAAYEVDAANKTAHPAAFDHDDLFSAGGGTDVVYRYWNGTAAQDLTLAELGIVSGGGCLHADPALDGSYHLKNDSPCINAGTSTEAPANDIDGDPRPKGVAVDIGADEAQ